MSYERRERAARFVRAQSRLTREGPTARQPAKWECERGVVRPPGGGRGL